METLTSIQAKLKKAIEASDKSVAQWVTMDKQDPNYYRKMQEACDLHKNVLELITLEKEEKAFSLIGEYWDGKGKYQEAYDNIWKKVPARGESDIKYVEAVRCMGRLMYEYYNNGNCNATEAHMIDCYRCGGSGYEDMNEDEEQESNEDCYECGGHCQVVEEYSVSEYYAECLQKVADYTKEYRLVKQVRDIIETEGRYSFSPRERAPYNLLCDVVVRKAIGLY